MFAHFWSDNPFRILKGLGSFRVQSMLSLSATTTDASTFFRSTIGKGRVAHQKNQASGRFLTEYEGFGMAFGQGSVDLRWYRLQSNGRAVAQVTPDLVPIELHPGLPDASRVWPIARRRAARQHPPPPKAPASAPIEDGDGQDPGEISPDEGADVEQPAEEEDRGSLLREALLRGEELEFGGLEGKEPARENPVGRAMGSAGGAAAPDGSQPPPPPPPQPDAAIDAFEPEVPGARPGGARKGAEVTMYVPGGSISFYSSKMAFEAVCDNPAHGRCVVTRTCRGKKKAGDAFARGGRPLGFLGAWLGAGEACATKTDHWLQFDRPLDERTLVRQRMLEVASGKTLASHERPREVGEPEEPESLAGYMY